MARFDWAVKVYFNRAKKKPFNTFVVVETRGNQSKYRGIIHLLDFLLLFAICYPKYTHQTHFAITVHLVELRRISCPFSPNRLLSVRIQIRFNQNSKGWTNKFRAVLTPVEATRMNASPTWSSCWRHPGPCLRSPDQHPPKSPTSSTPASEHCSQTPRASSRQSQVCGPQGEGMMPTSGPACKKETQRLVISGHYHTWYNIEHGILHILKKGVRTRFF